MTQSFNCPSCGGTLEYAGGTEHTINCSYCGSMIAVPEELWRDAENAKTINKWTRYIFLFFAITVGVPVCVGVLGTILGILATLLGIGGTIFAAFLPFIIRIFSK